MEEQGFGAWLRALPWNPGKIPYTAVSGFGDGFGDLAIQKPISEHRAARHAPSVQLPINETHYPSHYGPMSVDSPQASNMEITNSGEDFQLPLCTNLFPTSEVFNSFPSMNPSHNYSPDFEAQIEDIDMALHKFDAHIIDMITKLAITPLVMAPQGGFFGITLGISKTVSQDLNSHVENPTTSLTSITIAPRKWKKLDRIIPISGSETHSKVATKREREVDEDVQPELPNKKL